MKGVLVTGGSGGIGAALVRQLRTAGQPVVFTFRSHADKAKQLAEETGAVAVLYNADDGASRKALGDAIRQGELDGLVNLAANPLRRQSFFKLDPEALCEAMQLDLIGPVQLAQAFAARCRELKKPGAIVNVLTSVTLGLPPEKMLGYVMSKHALLGATRALAVELGPYGIRVNAVSPSMTRTNYLADLPERFIQMTEEDLPMQRLALPEEVAASIAFLLSAQAGYIQGVNLPVAGGVAC